MSEYISCADTAKLIRKALKESFPGVKFSVRSKTYSGGASINVGYTDGPTKAAVESIVKTFEGSYFDGMIDYKGSCYGSLDGEKVSFGADFIFVERSASDSLINEAIDAVVADMPNNFKKDGVSFRPKLEAYRKGLLYNMQVCGGSYFENSVQAMIANKASEIYYGSQVTESPTLDRVKFLGSDGYSASQIAMGIGAAPGREM